MSLLLLLLLLTIPHHYTIPYHTYLNLSSFLSTFITKNLLPPLVHTPLTWETPILDELVETGSFA
jgi:hypothetical protein